MIATRNESVNAEVHADTDVMESSNNVYLI